MSGAIRPRLVAVWLLLAALVGTIVVIERAELVTPRSGGVSTADPRLLLPVPVDQLGAIEVADAGTLHRFERDAAGTWFYHGAHTGAEGTHTHDADRVLAERIERALAAFGRTRIERHFALERAGTDYGVTTPEILVLVYRPNHSQPLVQYAVGHVAPDTVSRYVMVVGSPEVVTIPNYQIDNLLALIQAVGGKSDQGLTPARRGEAAPVRTLRAGLALVAAAAVSPAFAHSGGSTGYASIAIGRESVRYSLTLWPAALPPAVAEQLRLARAGHAPSRERVLGFIGDKVTLIAQGRRCEAGPGFLPPPTPRAESVTLVVDFVCGGDVRDLLIRDDLFDVFGADYHTLARIDAPGRTAQFAFTSETREARVTLDKGPAGGRGMASFVLLGIEHILSGYDHLLFLLGLLLRGGGWLSLAKIITAFTLAHSVTLGLAVLNIVVLPDRLVEAVIALSIAFVAAENLFLSPVVSRRWLVSFCFGLVHGFGFSSALRELGLPTHGLLLSLFGFNAGVEIGQALVVLLAVPALVLVRDTRWEQRMIWSSSFVILLVGLVLFVERAFL